MGGPFERSDVLPEARTSRMKTATYVDRVERHWLLALSKPIQPNARPWPSPTMTTSILNTKSFPEGCFPAVFHLGIYRVLREIPLTYAWPRYTSDYFRARGIPREHRLRSAVHRLERHRTQ